MIDAPTAGPLVRTLTLSAQAIVLLGSFDISDGQVGYRLAGGSSLPVCAHRGLYMEEMPDARDVTTEACLKRVFRTGRRQLRQVGAGGLREL